jgi:hypothetical protein
LPSGTQLYSVKGGGKIDKEQGHFNSKSLLKKPPARFECRSIVIIYTITMAGEQVLLKNHEKSFY